MTSLAGRVTVVGGKPDEEYLPLNWHHLCLKRFTFDSSRPYDMMGGIVDLLPDFRMRSVAAE